MTLDLNVPPPTFLRQLVTTSPIDGTLLERWTENLSEARYNRTERDIQLGLLQGENIDQIARRLRGTRAQKYKDGSLEISRRSAISFARTSVNTVSNRALQESYRESDVVKKLKVLATLDLRTSPICRSLDGNIYAEDDEKKPVFPQHPNCRSIYVGLTKSWRELGYDRDELTPAQRASMDGQVPEDLDYYDWLQKQSVARQEDVLGIEKARLFRKGKLTKKELHKANGDLLTVAELKEKFSAMFA